MKAGWRAKRSSAGPSRREDGEKEPDCYGNEGECDNHSEVSEKEVGPVPLRTYPGCGVYGHVTGHEVWRGFVQGGDGRAFA